jgi:hypothetical protein
MGGTGDSNDYLNVCVSLPWAAQKPRTTRRGQAANAQQNSATDETRKDTEKMQRSISFWIFVGEGSCKRRSAQKKSCLPALASPKHQDLPAGQLHRTAMEAGVNKKKKIPSMGFRPVCFQASRVGLAESRSATRPAGAES